MFRMAPTSNPEKKSPLSNAERKRRHRANLSEERKNQIKEDDKERKRIKRAETVLTEKEKE